MGRPRLLVASLDVLLTLAGLALAHGRVAGASEPQADYASTTTATALQEAHYIANCTNITSPGLYMLSSNISGFQTTGYCIGVFSSNVTLDGDGHVLRNFYSSPVGIYVSSSSRNVTIEDLESINYAFGIYMLGNYSEVHNVTMDMNGYGINVSGSYDQVYNVTLEGCLIYGIYMPGSHNQVHNVIADGDEIGLNVTADYSDVYNVTSDGNGAGLFVSGSYDQVYNVTAYGNGYGLFMSGSYDQVADSIFARSRYYGLFFYYSSGDLIYDNLFNNTDNVYMINSWAYWNVTLRPGRNILGGNVIGGNAWLSPNGTGFSQNCSPMPQEPDICSEPYNLGGNNTDYLPLRYPQEVLYVTTTATSTTTPVTTTTTQETTTNTTTTTTTITTMTTTTTIAQTTTSTTTATTTTTAQTTTTTTTTTSPATVTTTATPSTPTTTTSTTTTTKAEQTSAVTTSITASTSASLTTPVASRSSTVATYVVAGVVVILMAAAAFAFLRRR